MSLMRLKNFSAGKLLYRRGHHGYQDSRFPEDQYDLIVHTDEFKQGGNLLEVGCNQGKLVKFFADDGLYAVGIDMMDRWSGIKANDAIIGRYTVNLENISRIPVFDLICILSVHHQWVFASGDALAQQTVGAIFEKSSIAMFIEFSALAEKYGYRADQFFIDNDEPSVRAYAESWLRTAGLASFSYLGKTRELLEKEPYRFLYVARH